MSNAKRREIAIWEQPVRRDQQEGDGRFSAWCRRGQGIEHRSELRRTPGRRRARATSETVARSAADQALERYFRQAGKGANMRRRSRLGSRGFVDKAHDIVAVSAIVDSGDP